MVARRLGEPQLAADAEALAGNPRASAAATAALLDRFAHLADRYPDHELLQRLVAGEEIGLASADGDGPSDRVRPDDSDEDAAKRAAAEAATQGQP
jgi:hypothetical protein